jgi:hypothetical protein
MTAIPLKIRDDLTAMALAQLCKRATEEKIEAFAGGGTEAGRMMAALHDLREALAMAGFAPR